MARGGLLGIAALLAALLLGGLPAQAQMPAVVPTSVMVEVTAPEAPIAPLGPFASLPVVVRYTFLEVVPTFEATNLSLEVAEAPAWATVTLSPAFLFVQPVVPPCACERVVEQPAVLLVSARAEAPAFTPAQVVVRAIAAANGAYAASEGEGAANVTADFFSILRARVDPSILEPAPGASADARMTVTNLGNADTLVRFAVTEAPPGIEVLVPTPLVVGPNATGTSTWRVTAAPGAEGIVRLAARGFLAKDPAIAGDTVSPALRVVGERLVPASLPGPGASMGALGGVTDLVAPLALMPFGLACLALVVYAMRHRDRPGR